MQKKLVSHGFGQSRILLTCYSLKKLYYPKATFVYTYTIQTQPNPNYPKPAQANFLEECEFAPTSCLNKFSYPTDDRNLKTKLFMQKSEVNYTNQLSRSVFFDCEKCIPFTSPTPPHIITHNSTPKALKFQRI